MAPFTYVVCVIYAHTRTFVWFRSGYSNVNVSQSNTNNVEDDLNDDDLRPAVAPPAVSRFKIDTQKSIANVRKRVSALGDCNVDRAALAKSVLASRSLLERSSDVDRLLDGLCVPFQTSLDDQFRATDQLDRNADGADLLSRWKELRPNVDRWGYGGTPARDISTASVVVRSNSVKDETIVDTQRHSVTQRTNPHTSAERSRSVAKALTGIRDEDRPGNTRNTNTSASPSDLYVEKPQTLEDAAEPPEEHAPDTVDKMSMSRRSAQDDVRRSTETGIREAKENEATASGETLRPKSSSSARRTKTPAAPTASQVEVASQPGSQVIQDANPATSSSLDPPEQGRHARTSICQFIVSIEHLFQVAFQRDSSNNYM